MPTLNRAPNERALQKLIAIFLKAETDIINEIGRLRSQGMVDYHAVAALERVLPGARCYVRTPALWDGMKGSYLQPFGMIKWYSAEKRALWGEGTHGYMGLGFD